MFDAEIQRLEKEIEDIKKLENHFKYKKFDGRLEEQRNKRNLKKAKLSQTKLLAQKVNDIKSFKSLQTDLEVIRLKFNADITEEDMEEVDDRIDETISHFQELKKELEEI